MELRGVVGTRSFLISSGIYVYKNQLHKGTGERRERRGFGVCVGRMRKWKRINKDEPSGWEDNEGKEVRSRRMPTEEEEAGQQHQ